MIPCRPVLLDSPQILHQPDSGSFNPSSNSFTEVAQTTIVWVDLRAFLKIFACPESYVGIGLHGWRSGGKNPIFR